MHRWSGIQVSCTFESRRGHDRLKCLPLGFHSDVGIVFQHSLRDVPSNIPDGFIPRTGFGKIRDQRVSVVVPTPADAGLLPNVIP